MILLHRRRDRIAFVLAAITLSIAATLVLAASSYGQTDAFLLGNGQDGAYSAPAGTTTLNTVAPVSGAAVAGASSLTIGASRAGAVDFAANRLVMIHQSTGYTGAVTPGDQTAIDLTNGVVGRWEYARISSVSGTTLNFTSPLVNDYASGAVQVIAVPEYTTVSIASGRTLAARTWNGTSGGIVAILATGDVANNGTITASSSGFRGGGLVNHTVSYACTDMDGNLKNAQKGEGIYPAGFGVNEVARGNMTSGGGGANCHNSGGAGGGHAGVGGDGSIDWTGADYHAFGGSPLTYSPYTRMLFGGGGGAGEENDSVGTAGAVGGGDVMLRAASMSGAGSVNAQGGGAANSSNDGAGGGGAGGAVIMRFSGAATCSVNVSGGNGGNTVSGHGPGGGGAGGVALVQGSSTACTATVGNGVAGTTPDGSRGAGPATTNAPGYTGAATTNSTAFATLVSAVALPAASASTGNRPTISGTATPNATVGIYFDSALSGTTTATALGAWSYTPTSALADGAHAVYVIPTYQGTVGASSNTRAFIVDTIAPTAPTITTPGGNIFTPETSPAVGGTAEPDSVVSVLDRAVPLGTAAVDGSGTWSFVPSGPLQSGTHILTARATDAAGNQGPASASRSITIDATAPAVTISSPTAGLVVGDSTPDITFSIVEANPGSTACSVNGGTYLACASPFTTSTLPDGARTVSVRHTDAAGNVGTASVNFILDTTFPTVAISAPTIDQYTNDNTPDVAFSVTDANPGSTSCAIDAESFSPCTSPFTAPVLSDGTHSASVRHVDGAGNSTTTVRSFVIDTIAPAPPVFTKPAADELISYTTGVVLGTAEPGAIITGYKNGVLQGSVLTDSSGVWAFLVSTPVPEGTYVITGTATDAAGNVSPPNPSRSITVDTTSPSVSIGSPSAGQFTNDSTPDIAFSVSDLHLGVSECSIDGGAFSTCFSPFTSAPLPDGVHVETVRHTDVAGNVGSATRSFSVETGVPVVSISTPLEGSSTSDSTPTLTFSVNEANPGTSSCAIDGGAATTCSSPADLSTLSDGPHSVTVSHTDAAGNIGLAVRGFSVDTIAPAAPVINSPSGPLTTNNSKPTISGFAEAGTSVAVFDGETLLGSVTVPVGGNWSFALRVALSPGVHVITAKSTDAANNQSAASAARSITFDTVAPAAPVISSPASNMTTNNASPLLSGTAESHAVVAIYDGVSQIASIDADASGAWSGTLTNALNQADHVISAVAIDAAGNRSPASATRTITVDTTAPGVVINAPADHQLLPAASASVEFVISDSHPGTSTCAVDGGAPAACSSPFAAASLSEGAHSVSVTHTDTAGNSKTTSRAFSVDSITPQPPNVTVPSGDVVTSFTAGAIEGTSEPFAVITGFYLGFPYGTTTADSGGHWAFPSGDPVPEGTYTLYYTATDAAGHQSAPSESRAITVDTTNPVVHIDAPGAGQFLSDSTPDVTFSVTEASAQLTECSLDGSAFAACASPFTTPVLADGTHSVTVRQTDAAGNVGSATRSFNIDTNAPTVLITAPASGATLGYSTIYISFIVTERNLGTTTCSVDGGSTQPCTSPFSTGALADGVHSATVGHADAGGNFTATARSFTIDTIAPASPNIVSPAGPSLMNSARPAVSGTAEANAQVTVFDGSASIGTVFAGPSGGWSFSPSRDLGEGVHSVTATATDAAGNTGPASASRQITIDVTAPAAPAITTPASDIVTAIPAPDTAGTAEPNSTVTVYDGVTPIGSTTANGDGAWAFTPRAPLNEAAHAVTARATDAAGNHSAVSNVVSITIDFVPPGINIYEPLNGQHISTPTPSVLFTINELHPGTTECSVDGGGFVPCSAPFTTDALPDGTHDVTVSHTDAAGNSATVDRSFVVDTTSPLVAITSPAEGQSINTDSLNVIFNITDTSPGTTTCALDGGAPADCSSPFDSGPLSEGDHSVTVEFTDSANKVSSTTQNFNVDRTAPLPPVVLDPPPGLITSDVTGIVFGTSEPLASIYAYEGATEIGHSTADATGTWLGTADVAPSDGTHTYLLTATDAAGNESAPSEPLTVTIDTTKPLVELTFPTDGEYLPNNAPSIDFGVTDANPGQSECSIDFGDFAPCTNPFEPGALSDGEHYVVITSTDAAGNLGSTSAHFTVDTQAPTVAISSPAEGDVLGNNSPTIAFSAAGEQLTDSTCSLDGAIQVSCSSPFALTSLADGPHSFAVTFNDTTGNSTTAVVDFIVDTTAPIAPSISSPAGALTTNDSTPAISGSAESGASLAIFDAGVPIGRAAADSNGDWTFVSGAPLSDGIHELTVKATDASNNQSDASASRSITVDTTSPGAPTIDTPTNGSNTNDTTPTLRGTAEPNALVTILDDASPIGTTRADNSGAWTFTALVALNQADHVLTANAGDASGNVSDASAQLTITIDTTNPTVAFISPDEMSSTSDQTPTFSFYVADSHAGTTTCSVDGGAFAACSSPVTLESTSDGRHSLSVATTDAAGNSSAATRTITVDTAAPDPPVVTTPETDIVTSFTSGSIVGTSEPFATVTGYFYGSAYGSVQADADGNWAFPSGDAIGDLTYVLSYTATDSAGNTSAVSDPRSITVDTVNPVVAITAPVEGQKVMNTAPGVEFSVSDSNLGVSTCSVDGGAYTVCSTGFQYGQLTDGAHSVTVKHTDAAGNNGSSTVNFAVDTSPPAVEITAPATDGTFTNDVTPDIVFDVTEDGPGTSRCSLDGGAYTVCSSPWTPGPLNAGAHFISVSHTDQTGNSGSAARSFTVDIVPPDAPSITMPASDLSTNDTTPGFAGAAEVGSKLKFFDGSTLVGELTVDRSGSWLFASTDPFSEGSHSITAIATDAAGNDSAASEARVITIDTSAPAAPQITSPVANVATSDATPTIAGSAEAASTVTIYDAATPIGSAAADGSGNWSFTPTNELNQAVHTISAAATDAAGNVSPPSASRAITVDTTTPAVAVYAPTEGAKFARSTVRVFFMAADSNIATKTCSLDGGTPAPCVSPLTVTGLADGPHFVTVFGSDAAGNTASATRNFTVDTAAPVTAINSSPSDADASNDPTFSFSSNDPGATFQCRFDGGGWSACTSTKQYVNVGDGEHLFEVRATDSAGNVEPSPASRTWTIDTIAPQAPDLTAPADPTFTVDARPVFSGTAEPNTSVVVKSGSTVISTGTADGSGNWTATPTSDLADGAHEVVAVAVDAAGNSSQNSNVLHLTIDHSNPQTTITSSPSDFSNDASPSFGFSSNEPAATFECDLDGNGWSECSSPESYIGLADGEHTMLIRATDPSGNVESSPANRTWTIDTVYPSEPTVVAPADSARLNSAHPTVSGTAEANSTVTIYVDDAVAGSAAADASGDWQQTLTTALADGVHVLHAETTDAAGNTGPRSVDAGITIDTVAPLGSVIEQAGSGSDSASPTFALISPDGTAAITCRVDGGAYAACPATFAPSTSTAGSHVLEVRFTDAAGNTTTVSKIFTIGSTSPVTPPPPAPNQCVDVTKHVAASLGAKFVTAGRASKLVATVGTDQFIVAKITVFAGNKRVAVQVLPFSAGTHTFSVKVKRQAKKTNLSLRLEVLTFSGLRLATDPLKTTVTSDCAIAATPVSVAFDANTGSKLKVGTTGMKVSATSNQFSLTTFSVIQKGRVLGTTVAMLSPGKTLSTRLKLARGAKLAKGKATLKSSTYSVDGVRVSNSKQLTVR